MRYRLIILRSLWDRALAELTVGTRQLAWGKVTRSYTHDRCELIVRQLRFATNLPDGSQDTPSADWVVLDSPLDHSIERVQQRIRDSHLQPGQLLAYLQVGLGNNLDQWLGAVVENDKTKPISLIRLVGPGMTCIKRSSSRSVSALTRQATQPATLANAPHAPRSGAGAFSRLIGAMGMELFTKYRNTPVMIIGAGRLGSLMAESMIRMGLRKLTVVDGDRLEKLNLDGTFGSRQRNVGEHKIQTLTRYLHQIRPDSLIKGLIAPAWDARVTQAVRSCQLIVTCVDNDTPRYVAAQLANSLLKIHLDLGTIVRRISSVPDLTPSNDANRELAADVRLLLPGSCVGCVGGLRDMEGAIRELQRPMSEQAVSETTWDSGGRIGSLLTINQMAVGIGLQLWLDFLSANIQSSYWHRLRWVHGQGISAESGPVTGQPDCPICSLKSQARSRLH